MRTKIDLNEFEIDLLEVKSDLHARERSNAN